MRIIFFIIAIATLTGCQTSTRVFDAGPRIVSLSTDATAVLVDLHAEAFVVGVAAETVGVPGAERVRLVSGAIRSLAPTAVILPATSRAQRVASTLQRDGDIDVLVFDPFTIEEILESYRDIAALVDRTDEGEAFVRRTIGALAAISASVYGLPRRNTAIVVRHDGLHTPGGDGFVTNLIEVAGGENILEDLVGREAIVSLDTLAARRPDVLIDATDYAGDTDAEARAREFWQAQSWLTRVEFVSPAVTRERGPGLVRSARALRSRIHPERGDFHAHD